MWQGEQSAKALFSWILSVTVGFLEGAYILYARPWVSTLGPFESFLDILDLASSYLSLFA